MLAGDAWTVVRGADVPIGFLAGDCGDEESAYGTERHQFWNWILFSFGVNKGTKTILQCTNTKALARQEAKSKYCTPIYEMI